MLCAAVNNARIPLECIADVTHVVDCGKAKEKTYDALNNLACLRPAWISKASAHQRRYVHFYLRTGD